MNSRSLTLLAGRPTVELARAAPRQERAGGAGTQIGEIDEETLARARAGDRQAQELFVRWYERRVHAFLGRSLIGSQQVDDLAQEVFLRVLRALPRYEPGRARVSTWIFSIAVHLLTDLHRRKRWAFASFDDERSAGQARSPEEGAIAREAWTELERALSTLAPEQRMALALFEIHGLSHAEVAKAMGSSVATVKTRLFRARHALRQRAPRALAEGTGGSR